MRTPRRNASTATIVLLLLASAAQPAPASAQVRYAVHDLGQVDGIGSNAAAINDSGVVVGWMLTNLEDSRATRTGADGIFRTLPGLEAVSSSAQAINASGDITGNFQVSAYPDWVYHAMRYTAAGVEDLGTLGYSSFGTGINTRGQVAGNSYVRLSSLVIRAFIATPGLPLQSVGSFSGSTDASSVANGINDSGQVAGHAETSNGRWHAFRYVPGQGLQDLGTPVDYDSSAEAINASGQVVGNVFSAAGQHAFRYTDGVGMQDLHELGTTSAAFSINDQGDVVGYFYTPGQPSRAFLYTDAEGMIDLNSRIDAASGWSLSAAFGINRAGEIVGQGRYHGQDQLRAFKLTPIAPDTTPPTIASASADPALLWPPNGTMVDVHVSVGVTDNVDPAPHCAITGVSSSESGVKEDALVIGDLSLQLRAARDGAGSGRVYSLTITCTDASANQAQTVVAVRVPHDMQQ